MLVVYKCWNKFHKGQNYENLKIYAQMRFSTVLRNVLQLNITVINLDCDKSSGIYQDDCKVF
jgi:hypothetical protein